MNNLALIGGNIITMDEHRPFCEAVLIEDGKIAAAGCSEDIRRLAAERHITCIDLKGKTAVPGLHDCHVHVMGTGLNAIGIDLYDCASIADVLDKIQEASRVLPAGFTAPGSTSPVWPRNGRRPQQKLTRLSQTGASTLWTADCTTPWSIPWPLTKSVLTEPSTAW